MQWDINNIVHL